MLRCRHVDPDNAETVVEEPIRTKQTRAEMGHTEAYLAAASNKIETIEVNSTRRSRAKI
jgi:hypothetical protein